MSKILITADIHLGYPYRLRDSIWSMRVMREYAHRNNIEYVLVLGDLFHDRININIEVLSEVYHFMNDTLTNFNQEWVCFPGNHDMFMRNTWKFNSLYSLDGLFTVIDDLSLMKIDGHRFWVVPFIHYEDVFMKVIYKIEDQYEDGDILLTHVGVNNAIMNECFLIKNWNIINFNDSKFNRIYTGHFHCYQVVDDKVIYPGSPIPYRFDEGMVNHGFIEHNLDDNSHKFIEIFDVGKKYFPDEKVPCDFLTIIDDDVDDVNVVGNKVRVKLTKEYSSDELSKLRLSLKDRGAIYVSWLKMNEEEIDIDEISTSTIGSPENLFKIWVDNIDIKNLNKDTLLKLNDAIMEESKDIIEVEE